MELSPNTEGRRPALAVSIAVLALVAAGMGFALSPRALAATSTSSVTIADYSFTPQNIVVVIGINNTVTWTNDGPHTHTVTADDNSFASGDLNPGSAYTQTFTAPGNYSYHCSIHTFMKGTVVVDAPAGSQSTTVASSITTTTPTSTSSSGIPEFPYGAFAAIAITIVVIASYLVARQSVRSKPPP